MPLNSRHNLKSLRLQSLLFLLGGLASAGCSSQPDDPPLVKQSAEFRLETVARKQGIIWGMAFLPDGGLIYTSRDGTVRLINPATGQITRLYGAPAVAAFGQGGLLDVTVHPDFSHNHWVYFTYSKAVPGGQTTALARARLENDRLNDLQDLLVANAVSENEHHYGSRLAFDDQGFLFMSIGERGERHKAQSLDNHHGKILRLTGDGKAAPGNPFEDDPSKLPEIWSYGHRNPQGLAFDASGRLWESEHGPRGGDEINLILPGHNYGWPVITYGKEYYGPSIGEGTAKEGMDQPVKYYVPSIGPSGLMVYSGKLFPAWKDSLFSGSLKYQHLNRIEIRDGQAVAEERLLEDRSTRIRAVAEGPDGAIWFGNDQGILNRLLPAGNR